MKEQLRATGPPASIPSHAMNISKTFTYVSPLALVLLIGALIYTGHTTYALIAGLLAAVAAALYLSAYMIQKGKK